MRLMRGHHDETMMTDHYFIIFHLRRARGGGWPARAVLFLFSNWRKKKERRGLVYHITRSKNKVAAFHTLVDRLSFSQSTAHTISDSASLSFNSSNEQKFFPQHGFHPSEEYDELKDDAMLVRRDISFGT